MPILTRRTLGPAVREVTRTDPRLARVVARHGHPPLWDRPPGFRTLACIVLEQQVSLRSAASLITRLERELGGRLSAPRIAARGERGLRALGLTRQKASYLSALAGEVEDGQLDLRSVGQLDDAAVRTRLLALRGIGPWSVAIYQLMALCRPDIWPRGDLALHVAMARARGLRRIPTSDEAERYAERWRPWRSVAARILWHDYLSDPPERVRG